MERTVQNKRKKFLIIIPVVVAGLIIGSIALVQNSADNGKTKMIDDGQTPLAAPTATAPFAPTGVAAGGTIIDNEAAGAQNIQQLVENLAAAQENLNAAEAELEAARAELEELKGEAAKTEAELKAANDKVAEAQAKVDANKELKKIYEAAAAITTLVNDAVAKKGNLFIEYQLTEDGKYNGTKDLYYYFRGDAVKDITSTGANYAPGFTKAVNEYGKQNNLDFDLGKYFYKVSWSKDGKLNVVVATGENSQFWTIDGNGNAVLTKTEVQAYKFYGNAENGEAAGTLNIGDSQTGTTKVDRKDMATLSEELTNEQAVTGYKDEDIEAAEKELEEAKKEQEAAAASDKLAQDAVKDAENNVSDKQTAVDAAQAEVDSAQAELDAATAE